MDKIFRKALKRAVLIYVASALGGGWQAGAHDYRIQNFEGNIKYVQNDSGVERGKLSKLEIN